MTDLVNELLSHHGVKGMRWGVRKSPDSSTQTWPGDVKPQGVTIGKDGSISIEKGANLQRLVRSNGKSLPMKDLTYASINEYDNARYIKVIGGTGFLGGGRDTILSLQATQSIKAPSVAESTRIISELMVNDAKFRKSNTDPLGRVISDKDLKKLADDPTGKTAQSWYSAANTKLTFSKDFDPSAPYVQKRFRETFEEKGFNAVRDENDVTAKISKAPIVIFSPQKSLRVVSKKTIDDDLRKANKAKLKQYKSQGKAWVDSQLYGN